MKSFQAETIVFDDSQAIGLNVPDSSVYCLISFEAQDINSNEVEARFFEVEGIEPTATEGLPVTHLTTLTVHNINQQNFRIIGVKSGQTHKINIEYFG